jgi:hypothetical protein
VKPGRRGEDRPDDRGKTETGNRVLSADGEIDLTSLKDDELMNLVRLDIRRAAI